MQVIPTTKTIVEKLRTRAREIQRAENIAYAEAQDRAAQEGGYEHWRHVAQSLKAAKSQIAAAVSTVSKEEDRASGMRSYMGFLKAKGTAKVTPLPLPARGNVFHAVEIEGNYFEAFVSSGHLFISRKRAKTDPMFSQDSSAYLGVSEISKTGQNTDGSGPQNWTICKYDPTQPCVYIGRLSKQGRLALAHEFGIPSPIDLLKEFDNWSRGQQMEPPAGCETLFFVSPAFDALVKWVKAHPRKVRAMKCLPHYLGDWKSAAIAGRWPLEDESDVSDEQLKRLLY